MSQLAVALLWTLLIAVASPVHSQEPRGEKHEQATGEHADTGQQQQIDRLADALKAENHSLVNQLRSMQAQTEAEAVQKRADRNSWHSPSVILQILLLLVGVGYTIFAALQWRAISIQAKAANAALVETRKTAEISRTELELAHRPWVNVGVDITSGLTFDADGVGHITFELLLRNTGRTPAMKVDVHLSIVIGTTARDDGPAVLKAQCQSLRDGHGSPEQLRFTLFPDDPTRVPYPATIRSSDIEAAHAAASKIVKDSYANPFVVVCIDYLFAFAPGHHQTPSLYGLFWKPKKGPPYRRIEPMVNIPHEELHLLSGYYFPAD